MKISDIPALKNIAIARGNVFKITLFPEDGIKPKHEGDTSRDKYFVILGKASVEDKLLVASVLINTEINSNKFMAIGYYQYALLRRNISSSKERTDMWTGQRYLNLIWRK